MNKKGEFLTESGISLMQAQFLALVCKDYEELQLSPKELKSICNGVVLQNYDGDYLYELIRSSSRAQKANAYWATHTKEMSVK